MTISKEERAELRELTKAANGEWRVLAPGELVFANDVTNWVGSTERQGYTTLAIAAVNAMPVLLDALDAADARIAELEKQDARRLTLMVQREEWTKETEVTLKRRIAELEARANIHADTMIEQLGACDEHNRRIAELEAAAQWRPMDTAPRDGTRFLVLNCGPVGPEGSVIRSKGDGWAGCDGWEYSDRELGIGHPECTVRWLPIPALPEGGV